MPDEGLAELTDRIGETYTAVERFPLERGKIAEFAEAIGEDDPLYTDTTGETARKRGFEDVPVPLTFPMTSSFFRRRQEDTGRPDIGFSENPIHGEQRFAYERIPVAGEILSAEGELSDAYQRDGRRGGTMTFVEFEETYYDEAGEEVLSTTTVLLDKGQPPSEG